MDPIAPPFALRDEEALAASAVYADTSPNLTEVTEANPVPVIVTTVPPVAGPVAGEMLVTVGPETYVNPSFALVALVPPGVVTRTSTAPEPAGAVAVMLVAEFTV
jgi:hypothetical protein